MSLTSDIKEILSTYITNITVVRDIMPDTISNNETNYNCICVYQTPGEDSNVLLDGSINYECPYFQVIVRHSSRDSADEYMRQVKNILIGKNNFTINGNLYLYILGKGSNMIYPLDQRNRWKIGHEFKVKFKEEI